MSVLPNHHVMAASSLTLIILSYSKLISHFALAWLQLLNKNRIDILLGILDSPNI